VEALPERIPVELIRGKFPNFITARSTIERLKRKEGVDAEQEKRPARSVIYCQFCGRSAPSMQSLRAHLAHCRQKQAIQEAATAGVKFQVGASVFTVKLRSIKLLCGLDETEHNLAAWIEQGRDENIARTAFVGVVKGAIYSLADGSVSVTEETVSRAVNTPEPAAASGES
jgi:hypothetical protein